MENAALTFVLNDEVQFCKLNKSSFICRVEIAACYTTFSCSGVYTAHFVFISPDTIGTGDIIKKRKCG